MAPSRGAPVPPVIRGRLETQGFNCPDDPAFAAVVPWIRFSPALCTVWIVIGTALGSPGILAVLVPFAAAGAIHDRHPFDYLYNLGVRRVTDTEPLPRNGAPRRFACGVAAVWLTLTATAFVFEPPIVGYALGAVIAVVGAIVSTTHFCIPSTIYRLLVRRPSSTTA